MYNNSVKYKKVEMNIKLWKKMRLYIGSFKVYLVWNKIYKGADTL